MTRPHWTPAGLTRPHGTVAIVTGANSGIGYELTGILADANCTVIMASRNLERLETAHAAIMQANPNRDVRLHHLDLADLSSVEAFARWFEGEFNRLDILCLNAGIMMGAFALTKDGIEQQFGINHLGHYALVMHLMGTLMATPEARVVATTSMAHSHSHADYSDINYEHHRYGSFRAYARSKMANLLFIYGLNNFIRAHDLNMLAVAGHPGVSQTNLLTNMERHFPRMVWNGAFGVLGHPPAQACLPMARAALDPDVRSGQLYGPSGLWEAAGHPVLVQSSLRSYMADRIDALLHVSEQYSGLTLPDV